MKPYYYVFKTGGEAPQVKHNTLQEAFNESRRLAQKHPGDKFEILSFVAVSSVDAIKTEWSENVII
jgi:hypothetical protein